MREAGARPLTPAKRKARSRLPHAISPPRYRRAWRAPGHEELPFVHGSDLFEIVEDVVDQRGVGRWASLQPCVSEGVLAYRTGTGRGTHLVDGLLLSFAVEHRDPGSGRIGLGRIDAGPEVEAVDVGIADEGRAVVSVQHRHQLGVFRRLVGGQMEKAGPGE